MPYSMTVTSKDLIASNHYRMTERPNNEIINGEIDLKNKVLSDKRKSMIQVLKDKRPFMQSVNKALEENKSVLGNLQSSLKVSG